ncbi:MAG: hypothetical protein ACTSX6_00190 [Candidatus Heimdallarchaeaceae archaeon]
MVQCAFCGSKKVIGTIYKVFKEEPNVSQSKMGHLFVCKDCLDKWSKEEPKVRDVI